MAPRWARLCQGRGGDQGGLAIALLNPDRRKTWREAMGALTPPESRFHIMTLLIAIAGFAMGRGRRVCFRRGIFPSTGMSGRGGLPARSA